MFHTGRRTAGCHSGLVRAAGPAGPPGLVTASVATWPLRGGRHRSVMAVQLRPACPRPGRHADCGRVGGALGLQAAAAHPGTTSVPWTAALEWPPCSAAPTSPSWALSSLLVFLLMVAVYTRIFFYVRRVQAHVRACVSCHPRYRETTLNLVRQFVIILRVSGTLLPDCQSDQAADGWG